jgi:hypothetical protein
VTAEKRDLKMGQDHNFVILDWKNREEGGIVQGRSGMDISITHSNVLSKAGGGGRGRAQE